MITFDQARESVRSAWPDYDLATYGFETDEFWLLTLLPITADARVPAVRKGDGELVWMTAYDPRYDESRPVGLGGGKQ